MALIKCPECGREISDNAQFCPNCGYDCSSLKTEISQVEKDRHITAGFKTTTGLILNSVATVFWAFIFVVIFVVMGGITIYASTTDEWVNPDVVMRGQGIPVYHDTAVPISWKDIEQYKEGGYDIEYLIGDDLSVTGGWTIYLGFAGSILTSILGFLSYLVRENKKRQLVVTSVFLGVAIITLIIMGINMINPLIMTCGIASIVFVPCILQIVSAVKYMSGARLYGKE